MTSIAIDPIRFLKGFLPSVVLKVPTCWYLVANPAHQRAYEDVPIPISTTRDELDKILRDSPEIESDRACYCELINSVLALRGQECVFELANNTLKRSGKKWFSSLEFRWLSQLTARRYNVDNMFARVVAEGCLEARHAGLAGLEVAVVSTGADTLPPKALSATIYLNGSKWLGPIQSPVTPDETYWPFYELMEKASQDMAVGNLREVRERVLKDLPSIAGLDYGPIRAFVNSLFENKHKDDIEHLKKQFHQVAERVFDAPFLMQHVLPAIRPLLSLYSGNAYGILNPEVDMGDGKEGESFAPEIETSRIKRVINRKGFERQLDALLKTDEGKFVALWNGEVVDRDLDQVKLLVRASKKYTPAHLLICKVTREKTQKHASVETPSFERE